MKRTEKKIPFKYYDYGMNEWIEGEERDYILNNVAYYIGWIIIEFNSLEDTINWHIKEILSKSEGQDETVYLFLSNMSVSQKVDLLIKLYGNWVLRDYELKELRMPLESLEQSVKLAIKRRNRYAHANWAEIYNDNYIKVKTEAKKDGVYHTFVKFEEEHMEEDLILIQSLHDVIHEFHWNWQNTLNSKSQKILIFSYGSNMLMERLNERVPSSRNIGIGKNRRI